MERSADSRQRVLWAVQDVLVGQSENVEAVLDEPLVASPITITSREMRRSIDFND